MFLHEHGYTNFNIPNLLYCEIGGLVDAYNRKMKNQEKQYKEAERKAKASSGRRR